jgi:hypothetical protein
VALVVAVAVVSSAERRALAVEEPKAGDVVEDRLTALVESALAAKLVERSGCVERNGRVLDSRLSLLPLIF